MTDEHDPEFAKAGVEKVYVVGWAYTEESAHEDGCGPASFDVLGAYDGPDARANAAAYAETRRVIEHAALSPEERAGEEREGQCTCGPEVLAVPLYHDADGPRPVTVTTSPTAAVIDTADRLVN